MKKIIFSLTSFILLLSLTLPLLSSCGESKEDEIYYLNFKPEVAEVYKNIAADYEKETGVKLKVSTAASGSYEQTLKSEITKKDAPVIFQINGPVGYVSWKNYCLDLKDTEIYKHLIDKSQAITGQDGGVYGIPFAIEGYGIIYNQAKMNEYFALTGRQNEVNSVDEIINFETLSLVVRDMTRHLEELSIDGVFSSTSLYSGEDWRWHTHLANVPFYYEIENKNLDPTGDLSSISFEYSENMKNLFDLYLDNSVSDKRILGSKSVSDSMSEFALGRSAMVQNGNWAWSQINGIKGNTVKEEDIGFLPLYIDMDGEEKQGLCIGTENYFAINKEASEEKQKMAADFLLWLYSSSTGKKYITEQLGFITPFDTFSESEIPNDPLAREVSRYMERDDLVTVPWHFSLFPSSDFKNDFGAALLQYAQGTKDWENAKRVFETRYKEELSKLKK